jgi:hypothetical protein
MYDLLEPSGQQAPPGPALGTGSLAALQRLHRDQRDF